MRDKLLTKMHVMINRRLEEIGQADYDCNLSELNDPVINAILEIRREIFSNKVQCDSCSHIVSRLETLDIIWPE